MFPSHHIPVQVPPSIISSNKCLEKFLPVKADLHHPAIILNLLLSANDALFNRSPD